MVLNSANFLSWEDVIGFLRNILFDFGPKLIIAGLILYIGFRIIKFLTKKLNNIFEKKNLDKFFIRIFYKFLQNVLAYQ